MKNIAHPWLFYWNIWCCTHQQFPWERFASLDIKKEAKISWGISSYNCCWQTTTPEFNMKVESSSIFYVFLWIFFDFIQFCFNFVIDWNCDFETKNMFVSIIEVSLRFKFGVSVLLYTLLLSLSYYSKIMIILKLKSWGW